MLKEDQPNAATRLIRKSIVDLDKRFFFSFDFGCFLPLKKIIKKKQENEPTGSKE